MCAPHKPTTPILIISKMSLVLRILLAVGLLVLTAIIDILMFYLGLHATGLIDLLIVILALLVIFHLQWIDRWNKKNLEGIENSDPDLRRWM